VFHIAIRGLGALFGGLKATKAPHSNGSELGLNGAWGNQQVWRPHVRTWGLSEANVLYWRKCLWHFWELFGAPCSHSAPSQWFGAP